MSKRNRRGRKRQQMMVKMEPPNDCDSMITIEENYEGLQLKQEKLDEPKTNEAETASVGHDHIALPTLETWFKNPLTEWPVSFSWRSKEKAFECCDCKIMFQELTTVVNHCLQHVPSSLGSKQIEAPSKSNTVSFNVRVKTEEIDDTYILPNFLMEDDVCQDTESELQEMKSELHEVKIEPIEDTLQSTASEAGFSDESSSITSAASTATSASFTQDADLRPSSPSINLHPSTPSMDDVTPFFIEMDLPPSMEDFKPFLIEEQQESTCEQDLRLSQQTLVEPNTSDGRTRVSNMKQPDIRFMCGFCRRIGFDSGKLHHFPKGSKRIYSRRHPFRCGHCESTFCNRIKLKIHLLKHDRGTPTECKCCNEMFLRI